MRVERKQLVSVRVTRYRMGRPGDCGKGELVSPAKAPYRPAETDIPSPMTCKTRQTPEARRERARMRVALVSRVEAKPQTVVEDAPCDDARP